MTLLNIPEFNFHGLQGKPKRYSINVNGPWIITIEWEDGDALREVSTMTEISPRRPLERPPLHPGEILREKI